MNKKYSAAGRPRRPVKAIMTKQAIDMFKNPMILVNFLLFPAVALLMTIFVERGNDDIPNNMFVTMMAAIFAGMALISVSSGAIAEDIEQKCLRFLVLAGVKPGQYLLGMSGCFMIAGTAASFAFALIGDFTVIETLKFLAVMISGAGASILLGATLAVLSNRQAANALVMPVAVIVGFAPMISNFNETVKKFAGVLYTQQINVIVNDFSAGLLKPMLVIAANIAVLTVLFIIAYKKRGLKG
jgi:ABC-2 type transport system permease protein